jgi:DNA transformation protein
MSNLKKLPNIGPELAKRLEIAGINSSEKLIEIGTKNAFIRLKTVFPEACYNQLYALEGAVQGICWHKLSFERKQELKDFMRMIGKE